MLEKNTTEGSEWQFILSNFCTIRLFLSLPAPPFLPTYMQEVRIVQKIYEYPSADGDKHCACFLLLEAEGKSLLIDHRLRTVSTQQEPLHTHSSVCGHEELLKAPVCSLANCFEGFTIHKGNFYLMSFHDIGRDMETKSVYSKQDNRPHPLPSHPVCLQTDHFSITGCTILASFTLINNQLQTPHSYFSLKRALQLPPLGNFLFLW